MKKIIHAGIIAALLFAPFATSAQTSTDLAAQAEALLLKIQQLQQQLGASAGISTTVTNPTAGTTSSAACPLIGRTLKRGSSGDDVTRLQQFLARDTSVYPEGTISGYYGALTEAAVKRWQVKFNIVSSGTPATTGYGVVGPRTAAAISLQCTTGGGSGAVGGFIQVTPTSGTAPLAVNLVATVNTAGSCAGAVYSINWGDGSAPHLLNIAPGNCGTLQQSYQHTYIYGGTYIVKLASGAHETSATVQVSGPVNPGTPTTPSNTTGQAQLNVSVSASSVKQGDSLSISWQSQNAPANSRVRLEVYRSDQATVAGNSDNGIEQGQLMPINGSVAWRVPAAGAPCLADGGYVSCINPGSYRIVAKLYTGNTCWGFCAQGEARTIHATAQSGVFTISGTAPSQYDPFALTPNAGGNPLAASVQFPYTALDGYTLNWGDSVVDTVSANTTGSATLQTKTLSHTYQQGGSYTVTLVRGSQQDTASLTISN